MRLILLVILLFPFQLNGQNLLSNGSFEDTISCPMTCGLLHKAVDWFNPCQFSSPDLMHSCSISCDYDPVGYQLPRTGIAYAGFGTGYSGAIYREYLETVFMNPLVSGNCYQVEFYISAGHLKHTTDDIHVYFSDTLILSYPIASVNQLIPDIINTPGNYPDTTNWTLVTGTYTASGGENYMIIGNIDTANTNYIIIDSTSTNNGSFIYIDDVSLIQTSCTGINEPLIPNLIVSPNPASGNIQFQIDDWEVYELELFDMIGKKCFKSHFQKTISIDISTYAPGIYFYSIYNYKYQLNNKIVIN